MKKISMESLVNKVGSYEKLPNTIVLGGVGSGKSTILKGMISSKASKGDFIRGIDFNGEYRAFVLNSLKGRYISFDGTDEIINPLQIFPLGIEVNTKVTFLEHISKVTTFYKFFSEDASEEEIEELRGALKRFYESFGFTSTSVKITDKEPSEYPIFEDFLSYLHKDFDNFVSVSNFKKIILVIEKIVSEYSHLFNGHTTISDLMKEQVTFFSIRKLMSFEKNILNAQIYNILHLVNSDLMNLRRKQFETEKLNNHSEYILFIDEGTTILEDENITSFLGNYSRVARQYLGGVVLGLQTVNGLFSTELNEEKYDSHTRFLFDYSENKIIMYQRNHALPALKELMGTDLNENEFEIITKFKQGQLLLLRNSSSESKEYLTVQTNETELNFLNGTLN